MENALTHSIFTQVGLDLVSQDLESSRFTDTVRSYQT